MRGGNELRTFLARILGWSDTHAVELALSSVTLAAAGCIALVLCGAEDMVPIAWALHRRVREPGRPFVVADPRRGDQRESVRSPTSHGDAIVALDAARRGGTFCMRLVREPADLIKATPLLRAADDVMLVICGAPQLASDALLIRPAPVVVPPLASRARELERIVDEYAADAAAELHATLTDADRDWVLRHAATSLDEIHKATRRLAVIRAAGTPSAAAKRLGMAPVSLLRWLDRRR